MKRRKEEKYHEKEQFCGSDSGNHRRNSVCAGHVHGLITEWNARQPGIVLGVLGVAVLLIMLLVWRKMENKEPIHLSGKAIGTVLLGILGALVLGVGMCLTMVWSRMIVGILVGIVGIVLLLCLIPMVKGIK